MSVDKILITCLRSPPSFKNSPFPKVIMDFIGDDMGDDQPKKKDAEAAQEE
jgi:hypothetical protein